MDFKIPPIAIEMLIWFHVRPDPLPNETAPVAEEWINYFLDWGVIEPEGDTYRTTSRGVAWVRLLCTVPPPEARYVDRQGNIIK